MVTLLCFLSWGFSVVLLELDEGFKRGVLTWLIWGACSLEFTAISGMSRGTSMWRMISSVVCHSATTMSARMVAS